VRSLSSFSKHRPALFATRGTAQALGLSAHRLTTLIYGDCAQIGSVTITPIKTSHDAAEPCGLFIESGDIAIGLITDLGAVTDDISGYALRCNLLILEANHDREMLRTGPYPAHLKRRVASDLGHLSNDQAGEFLVDVVTDTDGPLDVWLAHLSATNNTPLVATGTVIARMTGKRTPPQVCALPRLIPGPTWDSESVRKRPLQLALDV
jgi:phosphoribosyl 1,2-cyclic phosphodiesterase